MQSRIRAIDAFPVACTLPRPIPGAYLLRTRVADALIGMDALASDLVHERAARPGVPRGLLGAVDIAIAGGEGAQSAADLQALRAFALEV